ncbi:MAG: hypothetical protein IH612_02430 [Desulfofustis sp.]|nr:hypothetical protein [Desulfofustis sp.]
MIVRILLAAFASLVAGVCYSAGLLRVMSALLVGFGALAALFFGILFLLPPNDPMVTFSVAGPGESWPFFLIAAGLVPLIIWLLLKKSRPATEEPLGVRHWQYLGFGLLIYLCSIFLPVLFWFPSDEMRRTLQVETIELLVLAGVCLFLAGSAVALLLLYRASKGTSPEKPDLMRRLVLTIFSVAHLDKVPVLITYLLIYSEEPSLVFPRVAALALAGYFLIAYFLGRICLDARTTP